MRGVVAVLFLGGCSGAIAETSPYVQTLPNGPCAVEGVTGSVPGVTLAIRGASCVVPRGSGATFTYEVTTDGTVPAITVLGSGGGCGPCHGFSTDPGSFLFARIEGVSPGGEQQSYCICDVGCCPPTQDATIVLSATTSSASYTWSGRNWAGPSDTGNPEGEFFVQGVYAVDVTFSGFEAGQVLAQLPIEVIDP